MPERCWKRLEGRKARASAHPGLVRGDEASASPRLEAQSPGSMITQSYVFPSSTSVDACPTVAHRHGQHPRGGVLIVLVEEAAQFPGWTALTMITDLRPGSSSQRAQYWPCGFMPRRGDLLRVVPPR